MEKKGSVVIISGPSGVGKSTICRALAEKLENVYLSVSTSTRPAGVGEVDGRHYHFVSREEFEKQIKAGNFLEYAEVFGNFYGTPKDKVVQALNQGKVVILEIDTQGAIQVKKIIPEAKMIFILPPKKTELLSRLNGRGRDEKDMMEKRLFQADSEIATALQHYEYMVINEDLNHAVEEVIGIIKPEPGEQK
ncbi:MAG: guanylate kinase [Planctomycetes bacterium]|nr:guanylate kinase [Planctomycetota bacterium]